MSIRDLTITGAFDFEGNIDPEALTKHLAECLHGAYASEVTIEGFRVAFKAGAFRFVSNWNVLVPFGHGDLTVDPIAGRVSYTASFRQLIIIATGMVSIMGIFILLTNFSSANGLWPTFFVVPFMWLWLFGVNLAIGNVRFQNFVRRSIDSAPRLVRDGVH